jgi:hypothetical protein
MKTVNKLLAFAAVGTLVLAASPPVYAALTATSTLSQTITNGTLSTDVRDGSNVIVGSPSFTMAARNVSTSQQSTTGTFGAAAQRISVDNPGGANNGFSITLNATVPGTGKWDDGASHNYLYNGTAGTGQLTVDPSVSTWTALVGTATSITKGTSTTFTGSTAISLATTSAALEDIWNGYMTGTGLTQTIPANTPAGTYTISMTQTVAAL